MRAEEADMVMAMESERLTAMQSGARKRVRLATAAISLVVAGAYLVLALLVARAQSGPDWTIDSIYGLYLFAAVPYLGGGVLAVRLDRQSVWALGAFTQVAMVAGLLWLGLQVIGPRGPEGEPTVFDYEPLSGIGMGWWAAAITGAQLVLIGLLAYLAVKPLERDSSRSTR